MKKITLLCTAALSLLLISGWSSAPENKITKGEVKTEKQADTKETTAKKDSQTVLDFAYKSDETRIQKVINQSKVDIETLLTSTKLVEKQN